jgi:YegS/Rv2252/BmrU family lipid kinase
LHTAFIINPAAGGEAVRARLPDITEALRGSFVAAPSVFVTGASGEACDLARSAASDHDVVVAVGGDGTVSEVARGIVEARTRAALGIVPVGTGNDLSNALGIPSDIAFCLALVRSGRSRPLDCGTVRVLEGGKELHSMFVNVLGAGLDAEIAASVQTRKPLPGLPGYVLAALRELARWRSVPVQVSATTADSSERGWSGSCVVVTVGNGPRSGGGFRLTPGAHVGDGKFDVCVVEETSRLRLATLLPRALVGRHVHAPEVTIWHATSLSLTSSRSIAVHADGEVLSRCATSLDVTIVPGAIRVIAP